MKQAKNQKKEKNIFDELDAQNSALQKIINGLKKSFNRNADEKKNKRFIFSFAGLLFLFISFQISVSGQESGQRVFSNAGSFYKVSGQSLEWTLGEAATYSFKNGNISISQGFHQTGLLPTSIPGIQLSDIKLYPNPFSSVTNLQLSGISEPATAEILDISGKSLWKRILKHPENNLELEQLKPGMYFLRLSTNQNYSTFKIIKQ